MRSFSKIKALVMDVDGTLTDGKIYIGNDGEVMKAFNVRDGYAIHNMLPELGIVPIIITGRRSQIVKNRCEELGIKVLVQNSCDKVKDMQEILKKLGIQLSETAYIGDDLNDLEAMKLVALRGCPQDAVKGIQEISEYVAAVCGGNGAVREFVEFISNNC